MAAWEEIMSIVDELIAAIEEPVDDLSAPLRKIRSMSPSDQVVAYAQHEIAIKDLSQRLTTVDAWRAHMERRFSRMPQTTLEKLLREIRANASTTALILRSVLMNIRGVSVVAQFQQAA
jgi:hypothetical protein